MKCHTVLPRLSRYLDHDLPPAESEAVAQHLGQCASCRAEAESLRAAERALQSLAASEIAPDLLADLRRRLAVPPTRPVRWVWLGGLAAATVVAALLVWPRPETKPMLPPTLHPVAPHAEVQPPAPTPRLVVAAAVPVTKPRPAQAENREASRVVSHPRPAKTASPRPAESSASPPQAEAAPLETVQAADGIILILGDPIPPLIESRCRLELTLADGTRSVYERNTKPGAAGQPDTVSIVYEQSAPETTTAN